MDVEANFDMIEVDSAAADVEERARRLRPAFREIRKPMRQDQRAHASEERGPGGAWPPRSPLTEARRKARNKGVRATKAMRAIAITKFKKRPTPKRILGRLPNAVVYVVGDLFIRATSRVPWSAAQQDGGRVGRGAILPARPFLWLSSTLLGKARDVLGAFIVKGWQR